jgi:DNA polymerase III subunit gamma/tau
VPEQALYLKWRPSAFDEVVGQDHMFSGPRGTGKTTTARLLAKAVNCLDADPDKRPCNVCANCIAINEGRFLDLIEIDAASHTGVDDVRDLRDKIAFTPGEGKYKVYIIDEVHRFSGAAFDALLKTLEEPPGHAIFVLATTEIDKVPATIKSRSLQFEFRRVSLQQVADRLQEIAESEGLQVERAALDLIARQGTGSVRDSISLLDQIVSDPNEPITLEMAQRVLGTGNVRAVRELVEAVVEGSIPRGLHIINDAIDSGSDPRQFGQQIVEHLRAVLLAQSATADLVEASAEDRAMFERQAAVISRPALLRAVRTFNEAVNEFKGGWQPQLSLELALIESIRGAQDEPEVIEADAFSRAPAQPQKAPSQPPPVPDFPEAEITPPGAPPMVAMSAVRDRWVEMLKVLNRYSSTGPAVVQHFRPLRIDGNLVYIATDKNLYYDRLNDPKKLNVLERAMSEVHKVRLRVQLALVDDLDRATTGDTTASPVDLDDPLLSEGLDLGGVIKSEDGMS